MLTKLGLAITFITLLVYASTYDYKNIDYLAKDLEEKIVKQPFIVGPYDATEPSKMPTVVPMTEEQRLYSISIIETVIKVVQENMTLEQAEASLFGEGNFFWPKDSKKPIKISKSYKNENFRMKFISISFGRKDQNSLWSGAALRLETKNSPESSYQIDLPASFFDDMVLDSAFFEERSENYEPQRVNIYKFHTTKNGVAVQLQFETREDMSSLKDQYPKSFHYLKVTRSEE